MVTIQGIKNATGLVLKVKDWLDSSAIGYLVKPLSAKGIGGFLFSTREDDRMELRSDVTDYVSEANSSIQSHIGLRPITITLRGFVGEVVSGTDTDHTSYSGLITEVATKLTAVSTFLPSLTPAGLQAQAKAFWTDTTPRYDKINQYATKAQNIASSLGITMPGITKQEQAFSTLKAMWQSRQVITVETPWGYYDNMAIMSVMAEQDSKTKMISDMTVSLKQLMFVNTTSRKPTQDEINALQTLGLVTKSDNKGTAITKANNPVSKSKATNQKNAINAIGGLN